MRNDNQVREQKKGKTEIIKEKQKVLRNKHR